MAIHKEGDDHSSSSSSSSEEWRTRLYFQTPLRKQNGDIRLLTIQPRKQHAATSSSSSPPPAPTPTTVESAAAADATTTTTSAYSTSNDNTINCFLRLDNIAKNTPQFTAISRRYPHFRGRRRRGGSSNSTNNDEKEDGDVDEDEDENGEPTATTTTTTIMINGAPAPIPRHLATALERLRRDEKAEEPAAAVVVVWVADLCVNAADDAERSAQAAQMAAIFAAAARTLVWLGEFSDRGRGGGGGGDGVCEAMDALGLLADEQLPRGLGGALLGGSGGGGGGNGSRGWLWGAPTAVGSHLVRRVRSVARIADSGTAAAAAARGSSGRNEDGGEGDAIPRADKQQHQHQHQGQGQQTPLHERLDTLRAPLHTILNHPYWTRPWTLVELSATAISSVEIGVACYNNDHRQHHHYTTIDLNRFHAAAKALDAALNNATVSRWLASGGGASSSSSSSSVSRSRRMSNTGTGTSTSTTHILATSEPASFSRSAALRMLAERDFHSRLGRGRFLLAKGGWLASSWYRGQSPHQHQPQPPPSSSSSSLEPGHDLLSLLVRYFYHSSEQANAFTFFNATDDHDGGGGGGGGGGADPHDTLYALLNLASDAPLLGLVPDYSKGWARVRAETSAALLKHSAAALVLSVGAKNSATTTVDPENKASRSPSWALDWIEHRDAPPMMAHAVVTGPQLPLAATGGELLLQHRPFQACGPADDRFYRAEVETDSGTGTGTGTGPGAPVTLVVKGAVVGVVEGVGDAVAVRSVDGDGETSSRERYKGYLADISRLWEEALAASSGKSPYAPEQMKVAQAKISIADAEVVRGGGGEGGGSVGRATSLSFEGYQWLAGSLSSSTQEAGKEVEEASEQLVHRYQDYIESLDRSATGRRPFLTDSGYVGTGPADLEDGDTITVPYGSRVPIALRRYGGEAEAAAAAAAHGEEQFRVVGPVYVFGIMDGEFMKVHRKETVLWLS
ncbi:hypothetical protein MGN70_009433 [Eutypa lata]|nr:hypothetical protein MGN70_009433 [Eutypa lata]